MSSARPRRYVKSGSTRSIPSISLVGNMSPVSTTTIAPSCSTTVMFLPISPRPPSGRIRTSLTRRVPACWTLALAGAARHQQAVAFQRLPDRGSLLVARGHQRQAHVGADHAEKLERGLDGNRVRGDDRGLIDRNQPTVDLARAVKVARCRGVIQLPHL